MDFETELMQYIQESEQRGNKVISIAGVKAIHARHALRNGPVIDFRGKVDGLSIEERKMLREANKGFKLDAYKEVR